MMSTFGIVHTAIGVIALIAGAIALVKYRELSTRNASGVVYVSFTAVTAATGLFIFHHGGFGPPHVFSIMTLVALTVGLVSEYTPFYGRWSRYTQAFAYTTTIFFHLIPAFVETGTRLPKAQPLFTSPDDPKLQVIFAVLLLLLAIGLTLQVRWIRRHGGSTAPRTAAAVAQ